MGDSAGPRRRQGAESESRPAPALEFGQVIARAASNGHDLEALTRPLLEALAKLSGFESTYLTIFDWERRQQDVRFVYSTGSIRVTEGLKLPVPAGLSSEALSGVTRSPVELDRTYPDSAVARTLGLKAYVSVPVVVAEHRIFGMLCGASKASRRVGESLISVMEFFAQIIADHVTRAQVAATAIRADRAEEQLHSRALFLAQAEHQLKTPLTVVEGASVILLDRWHELSEDKRSDVLSMLVRNIRELARNVDELLLEARADVQARELMPVRLDLKPLIQRIGDAFGNVSASHDVVVESPEEVLVWADPAALYQVLGHLLDNATKYSPEGGVIRLRAVSNARDVQIEVVDQGVGLPVGAPVFEAFQRGGKDAVGGTTGIGLGLHIVRNLVMAMGGSVAARSNDGRGSTFTVRLPLPTG